MYVAKPVLAAVLFFTAANTLCGQNPLTIPQALSGTIFNLDIQSGTQTFYTGANTSTYGINGTWLGPTIIVNKGDSIRLNVKNNLNVSTTIHWHGLHVAPQFDGGPHQIIESGTTWSPAFKIRNNAGTYWYHPHGSGKTDLHVSKGIAGMLIVKDTIESAISLPRMYGTDDFPIIIQSKAFDVLNQIAIATEMDTALFVNGTLHPYLNAPAQIIRLRLLNGSSMRTYHLGFTTNKSFKMIATDGGLLDSAITLTRIRLSPGERAEILVDLQNMVGQTLYLKNYGSELPDGIYGAQNVGLGKSIIPYYNMNQLNGSDYNILQLNVVSQTSNAVTVLPSTLSAIVTWDTAQVNTTRIINFAPKDITDSTTFAEGPFTINGSQFDMDSINIITYLNNVERWKLVNTTLVAHPFHIHDAPFYLLNINGKPVPNFEKGRKDVVLVMPNEYVEFITKFETFANTSVPYMYHCHLLHHEDDGMMGSFLVLDTLSPTAIREITNPPNSIAYPNPSKDMWNITGIVQNKKYEVFLYNVLGEEINIEPAENPTLPGIGIPNHTLAKGMYILVIISENNSQAIRLIKE